MRVLGIDPGASIGVAVLDVGPRQADVLSLHTWPDADEDAFVRLLDDKIFHMEPTLVSVERVVEVHGLSDGKKGKKNRAGSALASGLARGNWIGGVLAGIARARGLRVVSPRAGDWRGAIVGAQRATDAEVAQAIRLRCPSWPKVSNAHQRDAAGCALWAGLVRAT